MQLATYLNDHLAGSTAALELLGHLERTQLPLADFFARLRHDVEMDRKELEKIIAERGATKSPVREAAAWIFEKVARLKMAMDDPSGDRVKLLECLEAIAIGIHGKGALWRVLKILPSLKGTDFDRLIERADEQRARIEPLRLEAARAAFEEDSSPL